MRKSIFLRDIHKGTSQYLYKQITMDENSLIVEEITFDHLGDIEYIIAYNYKNDKLDTEIHKDGDKNIVLKKMYYYRNSGKLDKIVNEGLWSSTFEYEYLENGGYNEIVFSEQNKQFQRHFSSNGTLLWEYNFKNGFRNDYKYDDSWNVVEIREEHGEGSTVIRHQNKYDAKGRLIEVLINEKPSSAFIYENGRLKKEVSYGIDGRPMSEMTYNYD